MPDFIQSLHFSHPYYIAGILIPVVIMGSSYIYNFYSSNRYCDKALLAWAVVKSKKSLANKLFLDKIIPILAWILLCIALMGPRINSDKRTLEPSKKYTNAAVLVLDVSKSMLVEDVYPNRISKAKLAIEAILTNANNLMFSLVIYANNAHVVIPLTFDANVIRNVLPSIQPNMLPVEGSNATSGLNLALDQLNLSDTQTKSVFLFSDGDFNEIIQKNSVRKLNNIPINVFGVGTHEGLPIPDTKGGWLTINNKTVISRLNEVSLKEIARGNNGIYKAISSNLNQADFSLRKLTGSSIDAVSTDKTIVIWKQIYSWFLVPAIVLFLFSTLQYNRKKNIIIQTNPLLILLAISIISFIPTEIKANDALLEAANMAYHNKNFIKAEKLYKKSPGFFGFMGQANSVYKQKNYSAAIHLYTQAILTATNNDNRATALFNLANTFYMLGDYSQSISLYKDALKYNPTHNQSKINLEYAIAIDTKVKKALALRRGKKKIDSYETRAGNGSRSERIEQGVDIGNSKITLANDENNTSTLYSLPENDENITKLIERGIKYSNISSTRIETSISSSQWEFEHTTLDMVDLLVKQEKINNYKLWKRLFEIEEGFPAPVDTPHIKPGVNPW